MEEEGSASVAVVRPTPFAGGVVVGPAACTAAEKGEGGAQGEPWKKELHHHHTSTVFRTGAFGPPCVVAHNDALYLFGSSDDSYNVLLRVFSGEWHMMTPRGHPPGPRLAPTITLVDDIIYLLGGQQQSQHTQQETVFAYSIAENKWSCMPTSASITTTTIKADNMPPSPPHSLSGHTTVAHEGALYVFGGTQNVFCRLTTTDHTYIWSAVTSRGHVPFRMGHSAVTYGNCMWVFGGLQSGARECNDVHKFYFDTQRWERVFIAGPKPSPRAQHTACVYDHFLIVYGGSHNGTLLTDGLWVLDMECLLWHQVQHPPFVSANDESSKETPERQPQLPQQQQQHQQLLSDSALHSSYVTVAAAAVLDVGDATPLLILLVVSDATTTSVFALDSTSLSLNNQAIINPCNHATQCSLYTCGRAEFGQLGHGYNIQLASPTQVASVTQRVRKVICAANYTVALCEDGSIYEWGDSPHISPNQAQNRPMLPRVISVPATQHVAEVACAPHNVLAIIQDVKSGKNTVLEWAKRCSNTPEMLPALSLSDAAVVANTTQCGYLLSYHDHVWTWKVSLTRQVSLFPVEVAISRVACGSNHALFLTGTAEWTAK
eukprot:TRINITY_DN6503_c0_g1_i1.p1 TRINITY_DN6503_c0_g1~~TRINITY_DN6503_c0_g1_i1.p1  ORF type:complete len:620 (+),score=72.53 TRINITY_DN6503_c0_g1_i1:53-1861(+)